MDIKRRTSRGKKITITVIIIIVLAAIGYVGYAYATGSVWPFAHQSSVKSQQTTKKTAASTSPSPSASPSSSDSSNTATKQQDESSGTNGTDSSSSSGLKTVQVAVTYSSVTGNNFEIRSFVSGVVENGGTCTATLSQGSQVVTQASSGTINSSTTQCGTIDIPMSKFSSAGSWSLVVTYKSSTSSGTSGSMEVSL